MGYLGLVASPNPCDPPLLPGPYGNVRAFRGSPFGFAWAGDPYNDLIPYEIVTHPKYPSLFRAVIHTADTITIPSTVQRYGAISLDDSTIVLIDSAPVTDTTALRVLTRSGTTLSLGGLQQSHTTEPGLSQFTNIVRIDSSHFARGTTQVTAFNNEGVIQFFSVSGGSISLLSTSVIPGLFHPTNMTPPPATSGYLRGNECWRIFHSDGGGWLLGLTSLATAVSNLLVMMAYPYTLGGGISAYYWGDADGLAQNFSFESGKEGSTECLFRPNSGSDILVSYYWDGSGTYAGHKSGFTGGGIAAFDTSEGLAYANGEHAPGSYLDLTINDAPDPADGLHEGLISQSGIALSESPIVVRRECPNFHPSYDGFSRVYPACSTRHGPGNLVAESYDAGGPFPSPYWLLASTW